MSNIEFKDAFSRYSIGVEVSFAPEIELIAGNSYSLPVAVDDAVALTVADAPVPGASYRTYFVADGTNEPTIEGAFEHDGSSGYDDTVGTLNLFQLWHDGISLLYSWSQFADEAPALLIGAEVSGEDRSLIELSFSQDIDPASEPAPADFTLANSAGADPITDVTIAGSTVTLTRTRDEDSSTITVSYAKGDDPLKSDVTGADVIEFVTRSVSFAAGEPEAPGELTFVRLTNKSPNVTETANGDGWDYSVETDQSPYTTGCYARSDVALQADEDGYFLITMGHNDMEWGPIIGFTSDSGADGWQDITSHAIQIFNWGHYGVFYIAGETTEAPNSYTTAPLTGHVLKAERVGGDLVFSLSTDGGETFTEFNRESGVSNGEIYIFIQLAGEDSKISLPRVSGNWA